MKSRIFFLAIAVLTCLTSCHNLKIIRTSKSIDIYGSGIIYKPVLVDLDVKGTRVTGTAIGEKGNSFEIVKQNAVANALKNESADVLVDPKFETIISQRRITVSVTGYPAVYKNFRSIKEEDIPLLQVGVIQKANVYEPSSVQKRKGRLTGVLLGN